MHNLSHIPFRSWCPFCVKGRGESDPHKRGEAQYSEVAAISIDYMYLGETSEQRKARKSREDKGVGDESESLTMTIMVVKDRNTTCVFAHIVPSK